MIGAFGYWLPTYLVADRKSRKFNDQTEWRLNSNVVNDITRLFGKPNIDLFANSLNAQVEIYCSWKPDPNASFVDAFTIDWSIFLNTYSLLLV